LFYVVRRMMHVFFFQAEDGIRDRNVTGVQTCALPIFLKNFGGKVRCMVPPGPRPGAGRRARDGSGSAGGCHRPMAPAKEPMISRSEERRVGKESRERGGGYGYKREERYET